VHFVPCLGITNKCTNSYQFIISLSCSYMFWQRCAILRELVCTFWVTWQFGFLVDKILCSMWLCVCYVAAWCVSVCQIKINYCRDTPLVNERSRTLKLKTRINHWNSNYFKTRARFFLAGAKAQ
jgi:hypothetical protein